MSVRSFTLISAGTESGHAGPIWSWGRVSEHLDYVRARDAEWRRAFRSVSLATEYTADFSETEQTLKVLGQLFRITRSEQERGRWLRKWPAAHVMATTMVATAHYEQRTFWPKLCSLAGIDQDQGFQGEWGRAYLDNLRTLGLPAFEDSDDVGSRYVGRILMHCGMPTSTLPDFFRLVAERRRVVPGLTAEKFVTWATVAALTTVDRPVVRFLKYGEEFAVDVVDRTFDLLDVISRGEPVEQVALPERFHRVAEDLHRSGLLSHAASRGTGAVDGDVAVQPAVTLDPYGRGVVLRLPAVSEAPDGRAVWVVTIDSQLERVETRAMWPGSTQPAPATEVPIASPARQATAALEGYENLVTTVRIVDDDLPLLAFDQDGRRLAPGLPWRESNAWLLFPGEITALDATGDLTVLHQASVPPGWSGWTLVLADLGNVSSLSLASSAAAQPVRRIASARIDAGQPVQGVRTPAGEPVWSEPAQIVLPEEGGPDARWEVRIATADGRIVASETYAGAGDASAVWDELPRPLLGTFTVQVRGPWGRGSRRTVSVAEGLDVQSTPTWRRMTGEGLVPAQVKVATSTDLDVHPPQVALRSNQTQASVEVRARGRGWSLILEPAHMSLLHQSTDGVQGPTIRGLSLFTEDLLDAPGTLTLDVGAAAAPTLHVVAEGRVLQTVEPGAAKQGGACRYDLSRIVDTLRSHPQSQLTLDPEMQLVVAALRPRRLVAGLELQDDQLVFHQAVDVPGLTALIYTMRAPWRPAEAVPILEGRAAVPVALQNSGPLAVSVRIEDPWAPEPVPSWPAPGEARVVHAAGHLTTENPEETRLSAFLAGEVELSGDAGLSEIWTTLGLLHALRLDDRAAGTRAVLVSALQCDAGASLAALPQSSVDTAKLAWVLIKSGLHALAPGADVRVAPSLDWSRRGVLPSTLLISTVPPQQLSDIADVVNTVAGDTFFALLEGDDPHARVGRFDVVSDMIDRMDHAQRQQLKTAVAFVPAGLLSGDARAMAAQDLLENRKHELLGFLSRNAHSVLGEGARLLMSIDSGPGTRAVDARRHPTDEYGWRSLPAMSMALAFVARHAARGSKPAAHWMLRQDRVFSDLAMVAPDLVTTDLIIAELTLSSADDLLEAASL